MSLQLTDAIADGSRRVLTPTGGILFALLFAQQILVVTSLNTVVTAEVPSSESIGLTLPLSGTVAGAIFIGASVFNAVYFVILARGFARPLSNLSSFPSELYTRRIIPASLTMLVSGIIVSISTLVGFAVFFFPGLFLATCFLFVIFTVGVEDRRVIQSLKRSWTLSRGHRIPLGGFVLAVGIGGSLIGIVPAAFQLAGAAVLGDFATVFMNSVLFIFVYSIMASAYRQLADEDGGFGGTETTSTAGSGTVPEF